jgi:hypothetical protein
VTSTPAPVIETPEPFRIHLGDPLIMAIGGLGVAGIFLMVLGTVLKAKKQ